MLMMLQVFQQQSVGSRWLTIGDNVKEFVRCSKRLDENRSTKAALVKDRLEWRNSKKNAAQEAGTECNVFCETVGNGLGETKGRRREGW